MAATCCVSILPLVWRAEDFIPPNRRPALAIFSRMSLTSSPRYKPLIIFSNLQFGEHVSGSHTFGYAASFPKDQEPWLKVKSMGGIRALWIRRPQSSPGAVCPWQKSTIPSPSLFIHTRKGLSWRRAKIPPVLKMLDPKNLYFQSPWLRGCHAYFGHKETQHHRLQILS